MVCLACLRMLVILVSMLCLLPFINCSSLLNMSVIQVCFAVKVHDDDFGMLECWTVVVKGFI